MRALAILLFLLAAPAVAQEACPDFARAARIAASPARRVAPLPPLGLRAPAAVALAPTRVLLLETPTEHAAASSSFGGMLELHAPLSGRYRFALDGDAWIDLTRFGKVVQVSDEPSAHGCKLVDFDLEPGIYTVQLSDSVNRTLMLAVTPL